MDAAEREFVEALRRSITEGEARSDAAGAFYSMLKGRGQLKSHRVLTYRCKRRCLLLDVLDTRHGILVHQPRYRLSPALNAASSSEGGRAKNTEDGHRKWRERAFFLQDALNLSVQCDHLAQHVVSNERIRGDAAAALGEVTLP